MSVIDLLYEVEKWMDQINDKTGENAQVVLIANKIDLPDDEDIVVRADTKDSLGGISATEETPKDDQNKENLVSNIVGKNITSTNMSDFNKTSNIPIRCLAQNYRVVSKK